MRICIVILCLGLLSACVSYQPVTLKSVKDIKIEGLRRDTVQLTADVNLHNPNKLRARLKKIKVSVMVEGKQVAEVDQKLKSVIRPKSDFTVPIIAHVSLKELGLLDKLLGLLTGRHYLVEYVGYIRMKVGLVPVKVPIEFQGEVQLRP